MSWSPISLSSPASALPSMVDDVFVLSVTPWTHGIKEGAGLHSYLSFPNAISAIIQMLGFVQADAVLALAITAANEADFVAQCDFLTSGLPLKQVATWRDHAHSLSILETDKYDLVDDKVGSISMSINSLPTLRSLTKAQMSVDAKAAAAALASSDPLANLAVMETKKAANDASIDAGIANATSGLSGGAGWAFYGESDIITEIQAGHPGSDFIMTAIMVMIGTPSQLQAFREIVS